MKLFSGIQLYTEIFISRIRMYLSFFNEFFLFTFDTSIQYEVANESFIEVRSRLSKSAFHLFAYSGQHLIERFCQHRLSHMIASNIFTQKRFGLSFFLSLSLFLLSSIFIYLSISSLFFISLPSYYNLPRVSDSIIFLPSLFSLATLKLEWFAKFKLRNTCAPGSIISF